MKIPVHQPTPWYWDWWSKFRDEGSDMDESLDDVIFSSSKNAIEEYHRRKLER